MKGFAGTIMSIAGVIYLMLMLNIALVVTCAPLWALLILIDWRTAWFWTPAGFLLLGPGLAGAFAVFRAYRLDGSTAVLRGFAIGWVGAWRRLWPVIVGLTAFFWVVVADLVVISRWGHAALVVPPAIVLLAVGVATVPVAWLAAADDPALTRRRLLTLGCLLGVRRAGWSLCSVGAVVVAAVVIWAWPVVGLGVVAGPASYLVWVCSCRVLAGQPTGAGRPVSD